MADLEFTPEELQSEEWRLIPGTDGYYSVSSLGRIRRQVASKGTRAGKIMRLNPDKDGYPFISLHVNGKQCHACVHKWVALAFLGPRSEGTEVNHKNGIKTDNRPSNLEYITHQKNMRHAFDTIPSAMASRARGTRNGTHTKPESVLRGENHGSAKVTEQQAREIVRLRNQGMSQPDVASLFSISISAVCRIYTRRTWRHLDRN